MHRLTILHAVPHVLAEAVLGDARLTLREAGDVVATGLLLFVRCRIQEVIRSTCVSSDLRPRQCLVVKFIIFVVFAGPRHLLAVRIGWSLANAVLNVRARLDDRIVLTRARLRLHLEGIDVRLDSGRVARSHRRKVAILVLPRAGLVCVFSSETLIFGGRPRGCLSLVLGWRRINVGARHVTQTLIVDKLSNCRPKIR